MKKFKVGLQLFSLRDEMKNDVRKTLKAVKDMGYDYVELAGYYDMSAAELKALLDEVGLEAVSTHESYSELLENKDKKLDDIKTLGLKYFAMPWMGLDKHKGSESYDDVVAEYKLCGELLRENGVQFLYHNHSHEFERVDGKFVLEWLLEDVGDVLYPEIDICWVHYAGYKPDDYIRKFKNQMPILHLKDFACTKLPAGAVYTDEITEHPKYPDKEAVGFECRPVGHGVQDVPAILAAAEEIGTEYVIVEYDGASVIEPLEAVKMSREYLKSLGI